MKKTALKTVLCLTLVFCFTANARAFVFSDVAAFGQRASQFIQTATHYASSVTHFKEFAGYAQEFNNYRNQFTGYFNTFKSVYRNISSGRYTSAFNVSNWDWTRLDDHILRAWRSFNQASWDLQKLSLRTSQMFETNPAYRRYAERLIAVSDEKIESLKKEEALSAELEKQTKDQQDTLKKLRDTSEQLATQSDPSASELQSMTNVILLELARIQVESGVIEQRRQRLAQELQNLMGELYSAELEAKQDDALSLEYILNRTTE